MPIIRGNFEFEDSFTRIPNRWLRDKQLSLKAIGLLAQLHSHAPGWKVTVANLAAQNDCGTDSIRGAIFELETAGYLVRKQQRTETNRFSESLWITADPVSGFPMSGFPMTENPVHKKNIVKKTNLRKHAHLDRFDDFWNAYPRKVGKGSAHKAWLTLMAGDDESLAQTVIDGAQRLANDPNLPPAQFVPYPATWLNRQGWEDEPYPAREKPANDPVEREEKRLREREHSDRMLREFRELENQSAPPPECEHGKTLVSCLVCARKVAEND